MSNELINNKYAQVAVKIQEIFYIAKKPTYYAETQAIVGILEEYFLPIQTENAELKARLNFIIKSSGEMYIPPENSQNWGED